MLNNLIHQECSLVAFLFVIDYIKEKCSTDFKTHEYDKRINT